MNCYLNAFLHRDVNYVPNFFEALGHVHRRELIEVLGFVPSRITLEQLEEAFDVVEAICADESLRDELKRFCDDSDVKQICASLGVNHDSHSTYKLLIIDNEAATASGQMTSFIPTYDKLGALAKSEMTGTNPAHIDAVMTESYSKTYAGHVAEAKAKKIDLNDSKKLNDFATQKGLSAEETDLLETRHKIKIGRAHV